MALVRFSNHLPSVFNRFFDGDMLDWSNDVNTTLPSVNIKETKEGFELEVAAPGFDKNDFKLELNHDVLTISSEKQTQDEQREGEHYTRREYCYSSFKRSFVLPDTADAEKINAEYKDGILGIIIPKKEEAKPKNRRMIEIR